MSRHRSRRGTTWRSVAVALAVAAAGLVAPGWAASSAAAPAAALPKYDHVVVVVDENQAPSGVDSLPYISSLIKQGSLLTGYDALLHPSEGNYMDLFNGDPRDAGPGTIDPCPIGPYTFPNLATELSAVNATWGSYQEDWTSSVGTSCGSGNYDRKHAPWFNFSNVPLSTAHPFTDFPTTAAGFANLPNVSFVVPNEQDNMHSGSTSAGDSWLQSHLDPYVQWAKSNNSLFVLTWDEDNNATAIGANPSNVSWIAVGANVKTGFTSATAHDHFGTLRTLEDLFGSTSHAGAAANATDISEIFNASTGCTISVTNPGNQTGNGGDSVNLQVQATASGCGTLTYSATGLPPGASINSATGLITGTLTNPASTTTSNVNVMVADTAAGVSRSAAFTWTVNHVTAGGCTVSVTNPGSQTGTVGTAVSLQIQATASSGCGALTYTASGLPAGLSISSTTGLISGTPSTAGSSNVSVTATDTSGKSGSTSFGWTVNRPAGCKLTNPGAQHTTFDQDVSLQLRTSGCSGTLSFTMSGQPIFTFVNGSGLISGTTWQVGTFNVSVTVKDGTGSTDTTTFGWTVTWF